MLAPTRLLLDPPLDPTPEQAREALQRELARPEYADTDIIGRLLDALERLTSGATDTLASSSLATALVSMLVLLGLVAAVVALLSRARRSRAARAESAPVFTGDETTAAQLRARAEAALAQGDTAPALLDAFRALALRRIEVGEIPRAPGATAHEVSMALAARHPERATELATTAARFDAVAYGDAPAGKDDVLAVLRLDDALAGVLR